MVGTGTAEVGGGAGRQMHGNPGERWLGGPAAEAGHLARQHNFGASMAKAPWSALLESLSKQPAGSSQLVWGCSWGSPGAHSA
jgi:hypothetical protein